MFSDTRCQLFVHVEIKKRKWMILEKKYRFLGFWLLFVFNSWDAKFENVQVLIPIKIFLKLFYACCLVGDPQLRWGLGKSKASGVNPEEKSFAPVGITPYSWCRQGHATVIANCSTISTLRWQLNYFVWFIAISLWVQPVWHGKGL